MLLDAAGRTKLVDFSLAKDEQADDEESVWRSAERLGSPLFMAPEQHRDGPHQIDARADVWSLGVLLFVALTGRHPFPGRKIIDIYEAVVGSEPDWAGRANGPRPSAPFEACVTAAGKHPTERRGRADRAPQAETRDPGDP